MLYKYLFTFPQESLLTSFIFGIVCSIIENIPQKDVSFSDFIVTFAMSIGFYTYFDLQH